MLYGKDCQCYGREPRQNIIQVWKDYTVEDAIVMIEKAMKDIKPETTNSCWRKLCPDVVHDFRRFTTESTKEIMKEAVWMSLSGKETVWMSLMAKKKKVEGEGFQDMNFGEIQELTDMIPEKLTEDDLMKMSASNQCQTKKNT